MAMRQEDWHELYEAAEEIWGSKVAGIFMNLLPPVGWADVATKRDLDLSIDSLRNELKAEMHQVITTQTRTLVVTMMTLVLAGVSLAFAAAHF